MAAVPAIAVSATLSNRARAQSLYDLPDASQAWETFPPTPLPPLVFQDENGKTLNIGDFKGHVLLVNLWATWCPPCKAELPTFAALAPKLRSFGGRILPISVDEGGIDTVKAYFAAHNIQDLPVLSDSSGEDLNLIQSQGIPVTIIVRPDGKAVAELAGAADWNNQNVIDFLQKLAASHGVGAGGYS